MFFWGKRRGRKDRRRTARAVVEGLRSFYWTGGVPHPSQVRNISRGGAYVEGEVSWTVGTVLYLVLDQAASGQPVPGATDTVGLWARVTRVEPSGMALEFVSMDGEEATTVDFWERPSKA